MKTHDFWTGESAIWYLWTLPWVVVLWTDQGSGAAPPLIPSDPKVKECPSFSSTAEVLVFSEYTRFSVVARGFLHFLSVKLRDWNSGSHPVINEMLARDVFLDQTALSHCSIRIRTLSLDPWLLSPFSLSPLYTSRTSLFTPSLSLMGQLTSSRHMFLDG